MEQPVARAAATANECELLDAMRAVPRQGNAVQRESEVARR